MLQDMQCQMQRKKMKTLARGRRRRRRRSKGISRRNMQLVQIISGMKYQIYEAILQFWNWFDAGCLRWRISG
ncbi:hypothetical protein YC2023_017271 [Brassica napus]